jgi:hypothetical protein
MINAHSPKANSTVVGKQALTALLSLLAWAEKQNFNLPADLSEKHDKYLWEKTGARKIIQILEFFQQSPK